MCLGLGLFFAKQRIIEIKYTLWSSYNSCGFNETVTICMYYNKYLIYFNTFYDHLFYYQRTCTLPTLTPNAEFTQRLYSVQAARPRRSRRPNSVVTAYCLIR